MNDKLSKAIEGAINRRDYIGVFYVMVNNNLHFGRECIKDANGDMVYDLSIHLRNEGESILISFYDYFIKNYV